MSFPCCSQRSPCHQPSGNRWCSATQPYPCWIPRLRCCRLRCRVHSSSSRCSRDRYCFCLRLCRGCRQRGCRPDPCRGHLRRRHDCLSSSLCWSHRLCWRRRLYCFPDRTPLRLSRLPCCLGHSCSRPVRCQPCLALCRLVLCRSRRCLTFRHRSLRTSCHRRCLLCLGPGSFPPALLLPALAPGLVPPPAPPPGPPEGPPLGPPRPGSPLPPP